MRLVTIAQRKRSYARETGGRFVVFGSFVPGAMRHDGDLDILIDFEAGKAPEAWRFVEDLCAAHAIEPDLKDVISTKPDFVAKAARSGIVLP